MSWWPKSIENEIKKFRILEELLYRVSKTSIWYRFKGLFRLKTLPLALVLISTKICHLSDPL